MANTFPSDEAVSKYTRKVGDGFFSHEEEAVSYFGDPPARILDLGCGTGRTTEELLDRGFDAVGVDISSPMVSAAADLLRDPCVVVGTATALPFDDRSFDHVLFSFNGLDYIPDEDSRRSVLAEIHRVLEPGGRFVFSSHNPRYVVGTDPVDPFAIVTVLRFWAVNLLGKRLRSRYKYDIGPGGLVETYYITPEEQSRQLEAVGFDHLATLTQFDWHRLLSIDPWPYYVAEK
jgi:ubiquinone/menaquinone biosynthesis C-methylase UbiE